MNKESLKKELKNYKGKYSIETIDYLESLINLESSVASSKFLTDDKRKKLKSDEIYDKIKTYNIYYKTLKLLEENNIDYQKISKDDEILKLLHMNEKGNLILYSSNFNLVKGQIELYEYFYSRKERINELDKIVKKLNEEYKVINPYSKHDMESNIAGINWEITHNAKINILEDLYNKLTNFEITDEMIYKMELSNKVTKLFLKDYDLEYKDFDIVLPKREDEYMVKTLQLKKEDININRNIMYL